MRFDLQDLRLVVAVARSGSITAGATAVHLAVASASERLKLLESMAGAALFIRVPRGVVATAAGTVLVRHAQAMLGQADAMKVELSRLEHGLQGEVRVAANSVAIAQVMREPLSVFLGSHPGVNVVLKEAPSTQALQDVRLNKADFGVAAMPADTTGFYVRPVLTEHLVAVTSLTHPLALRAQVQFLELLDFDLLGFGPRSALQKTLNEQAAASGRLINNRVEIDDLATVCRMADAGIGIGIAPRSAAMAFQKTMAIRIVPIAEAWSERRIGVFWNDSAPLSALAGGLVDCILAQCADRP